jgi:hypothetical protein
MFGEIEDAYSAQREMAPQIEEDLDKDAESDVVFAAFQVNDYNSMTWDTSTRILTCARVGFLAFVPCPRTVAPAAQFTLALSSSSMSWCRFVYVCVYVCVCDACGIPPPFFRLRTYVRSLCCHGSI